MHIINKPNKSFFSSISSLIFRMTYHVIFWLLCYHYIKTEVLFTLQSETIKM